MLERPWSREYDAFVVFGAILLALLLWVTWQTSAKRQFYADRAHYEAQRAAETADAELEDCLAGPPVSIPECVERVVEAKRESRRAEYDLGAQQEVADWAPWSALGSIIAAFAAVIGVVFVAGTLREMQTTNRIAQDHLLANQRPWLKIDAKIGSDFVFVNHGGRIRIIFTVSNLGLSPALAARIETDIVASLSEVTSSLEETRNKAIKSFKDLQYKTFMGDTPVDWDIGIAIFPKEGIPMDSSIALDKGKVEGCRQRGGDFSPAVIAVVRYTSAINKKVMMTDFAFRIVGIDPDFFTNMFRHEGEAIDEHRVSRQDLQIVRLPVGSAT